MKTLELVVYPKVDRWVPWSVENYKGQTITGMRRERGYETPRGLFTGSEWAEKRLTDAELAAEYWAAHGEANATMTGNPRLRFSRRYALYRFATLPHYDDPTETGTQA